MENNMRPMIIPIMDNIWYIEEEIVRMYIIAGEKSAALIDCGMMTENLKELVKEETDLPIKVVLTHADRDHIACVEEFDEVYMNPKEIENLHFQGKDISFHPISEDDVIDLGGRTLKVIELPGHTPGSIALLDTENRILFSGDPVQDGDIFLFGPQRNFDEYIWSLLKLEDRKEEFDVIFPSHGTLPLPTDMIMDLYEEAKRIRMGKGEYTKDEFFGMPIRRYTTSKATFLLDEEN